MIANQGGVSISGENIPELESGDGATVLWLYFVLKMVKMVNFMSWISVLGRALCSSLHGTQQGARWGAVSKDCAA